MNRFFETKRVGIAGDWHGNSLWAMSAIKFFHENNINVIYQLGDFGVWGGDAGAKYLRKMNKRLVENDQLLIVTPGNHENYNMINRWPLNEYGFQQRSDLTRIWIAPRGKVWEHNGTMIASMGGAASVDLEHRTINKSWWIQEAITEKDIEALRFSMEDIHKVDILLCHDIPLETKGGMSKWPLPEHIEYYSYQQQVKISEAVEIAMPDWVLHGHWHVSRVTGYDALHGPVTVVGYDMDGTYSNIGWMDLENGVHGVYILKTQEDSLKVVEYIGNYYE